MTHITVGNNKIGIVMTEHQKDLIEYVMSTNKCSEISAIEWLDKHTTWREPLIKGK